MNTTKTNKTIEELQAEVTAAVKALEAVAVQVEKATALLTLLNNSTEAEMNTYTNK